MGQALLNVVWLSLVSITLSSVYGRIPGTYQGGPWQSAHATFYGNEDASGTMGIYLHIIFMLFLFFFFLLLCMSFLMFFFPANITYILFRGGIKIDKFFKKQCAIFQNLLYVSDNFLSSNT